MYYRAHIHDMHGTGSRVFHFCEIRYVGSQLLNSESDYFFEIYILIVFETKSVLYGRRLSAGRHVDEGTSECNHDRKCA